MSNNRPKSRPLNIEVLESRQMMAGDARAFLQGDTLMIREQFGSIGGAQNVAVQELGNKIRVTGFTSAANPAGSKINGKESVEFNAQGVIKIDARLGGGQDNFGLTGDGADRARDYSIKTTNSSKANDNDVVSITNVRSRGSVLIETGAGQDNIDVTNSSLGQLAPHKSVIINTGVISAVGDSDRDVVIVVGVETGGIFSISTGASNDGIAIKDSKFGTLASHTMLIDTGKGADSVNIGPEPFEVGNVEARGDVIINMGRDLEADNDQVRIRNLFANGTIFVELGGGADTLDMVQSEALQDISLKGMKGNDTMRLIEVEAREKFFANLGDDQDLLDLTFVKAKKMTLDGGLGFDHLDKHQMPFIPSFFQNNWEVINGGTPTVPGPPKK